MTGGGRRGLGIPLAERVRTASGAGPADPRDPAPSPARHCWVADAADGDGVRRPGLLVEWRQAADRWEGRVVYSARLRGTDRTDDRTDHGAGDPGREWGVVEEWLPADRLTPL